MSGARVGERNAALTAMEGAALRYARAPTSADARAARRDLAGAALTFAAALLAGGSEDALRDRNQNAAEAMLYSSMELIDGAKDILRGGAAEAGL